MYVLESFYEIMKTSVEIDINFLKIVYVNQLVLRSLRSSYKIIKKEEITDVRKYCSLFYIAPKYW